MHAGQAFLLVLLVLLLVNVPMFLLGFLVTKCLLYLVPSWKHGLVVRWVLPLVVAAAAMAFGVAFTPAPLEGPWPTSLVLPPWGCFVVLCLADVALAALWLWLKYREYKRKLMNLATKVVKEMAANILQPPYGNDEI